MTGPSGSATPTTTRPGHTTASSGLDDWLTSPESVAVPLAVLDGIVSDLFGVGLMLAACTQAGDRGPDGKFERARSTLDEVISQIRQAVFAGKPPHVQYNVGPCTVDPDHPCGEPSRNLIDIANSSNHEICTIELLDAAHSARRALVALQAAIGSGQDPRTAVADSPPTRQAVPSEWASSTHSQAPSPLANTKYLNA